MVVDGECSNHTRAVTKTRLCIIIVQNHGLVLCNYASLCSIFGAIYLDGVFSATLWG